MVDASVLVELVRRSAAGRRAEAEVRRASLAAPAHLDAEAFPALARLRRAGDLDDAQVEVGLERVARGPMGSCSSLSPPKATATKPRRS